MSGDKKLQIKFQFHFYSQEDHRKITINKTRIKKILKGEHRPYYTGRYKKNLLNFINNAFFELYE